MNESFYWKLKMTDVRLLTSNLIDTISELTRTADTVYWMTAFAMQSGVRFVLPHLQEAIAHGAEVKIIYSLHSRRRLRC